MTLRELHERIAASAPVHWRVLPPGPGWPGHPAHPEGADPAEGGAGHTHRAVLRSDVDLVLAWGWRESERDYFEPWLGNLGRMTEVRADRIVLDVLWAGSLVDRLLGLAFQEFLLPFPRSRQPRVKGLPDRYFARDEAEAWRLVHELAFPDGVAFDRVVHRSGLRVE
ncbi:hypothetical protein [Patulibacter minatonensis]|uniref:hypothetical protein n=1 Tax=Patulibacter minatonensis TaxID=298163 RepID=UPI0012F95118|nr:hypothetical protein [Patulibacter minatonensis]